MYTLHIQGMYSLNTIQQHMYILHGMYMLNPRALPYSNNTMFILSLFPAAV